MQALAIIALSIAAAVVYGILHDQVTARVCVEYFTIGHPPIFATESPTLLGLGWGMIATWWMGLLLGIPLALAAQAGGRPKRDLRSLVRPITVLLIVMATCALSAGIIGYLLSRRGLIVLTGPMALEVQPGKHAAFLADLWAHATSYLVGFVGGLLVILRVWCSRDSPSSDPILAEREGKRGSARPWFRFSIWTGLGLVFPAAMMFLGVLFERHTPYFTDDPGFGPTPNPWPASIIGGLLWGQVVHALAGVVLIKGKRLAAFGVGLFQVVLSAWVALHCVMAVTGVWL